MVWIKLKKSGLVLKRASSTTAQLIFKLMNFQPKKKKDQNETGKYITKGNVTEQGILRFFMNLNEFAANGVNGGDHVF